MHFSVTVNKTNTYSLFMSAYLNMTETVRCFMRKYGRFSATGVVLKYTFYPICRITLRVIWIYQPSDQPPKQPPNTELINSCQLYAIFGAFVVFNAQWATPQSAFATRYFIFCTETPGGASRGRGRPPPSPQTPSRTFPGPWGQSAHPAPPRPAAPLAAPPARAAPPAASRWRRRPAGGGEGREGAVIYLILHNTEHCASRQRAW